MRPGHLAATVLTVALAACGGGGGESGGDGATPRPITGRPSSTGSIEIVSPTPGQTLSADEVVVEVELTGARLAEEASTDLRPDQGHIHVAVDGETITLLGGLREPVRGLAPGNHLLEVEFAANDHGPFDPRVVQSVTFAVE
jgi:hypothetical protein